MTIFGGGTIDGSILPAQTGHNLGSAAQRWDLFSQDADISGSLTNPALPPLDPAGRVRFNSPTIFNSAFEEGGSAALGDVASGWAEYYTFTGGTFSYDINTVYSGIRSVKVHGIPTHYQSLVNRARFAVTVGDTISVRGAYYTSASTVLAFSRVTFFDKNDAFVDGAYVVNGSASVGTWTYASGSKVVPAGSVYAAWEIGYDANSTTNGDCFFDALWVAQTATCATVDLTAQGAAISATTIYAVPASGAGNYRISFAAKVTQAATTSCVLGGANGFQLVYTDANDSVVVTTPAAVPFNSTTTLLTTNTTQNQYSGVVIARCKASTNLQYVFGYTSVGATPMQFALHIVVEKL